MDRPLYVPRTRRGALGFAALALFFAVAGFAGSGRGAEVPWLGIGWGLVAVALFASRLGCRLDPRRREVRTLWTFLGLPLVTLRRRDLAAFRAVEIDELAGAEHQRRRYRLQLAGPDRLTLHLDRDPLHVRRAGERVAGFLALPLRDGSSGELVVRGPAELDAPVGQRLVQHGSLPPLPELPAGSGLRLRDGTTRVVSFPRQPLGWWFPALLVLAGAGLWIGLGSDATSLVLSVPLMLAAAVTAWVVLGYPGWQNELRIGPEAVEFTLPPGRVQRIPLDEVEEVLVGTGQLQLVSDRRRLLFPYRFRDPREAEYVKGLIEHVASARADGGLRAAGTGSRG